MNERKTGGRRLLKMGLMFGVMAAFFVGATLSMAAPAQAAAHDKVTICHATSSETNPYVRTVVSANATAGHVEENGTPKAGHEEDIILEGDMPCPGDVPVFPYCEDMTEPGDLAHYEFGNHQIVGENGTREGSDDVYSLSGGNALQCYCPVTGTAGIQTNWWKTDQVEDGWYEIEEGTSWGLDEGPYLAMNIDFECEDEEEEVLQEVAPVSLEVMPGNGMEKKAEKLLRTLGNR